MLNFVNILPVGADLLHADGQTDMTKDISRFSQFYELCLRTEKITPSL